MTVRRASANAPRLRSFVSALTAVLLVASMAVFAPSAAVAAAPTDAAGAAFTGIDVETSGGSVLAAGEGTVSVTAGNATTNDLYNASAVVVLPAGVTYVAGSSAPTAPNAVGEPQVRDWAPDPAFPEQTVQVLVWANVADLPRGAELDLSFRIVADNSLLPVGSTFTVDAGVYANANERIVPRVTIPTDGTAPFVTNASAGGDDATEVTITALNLSKSNADAESEVYRGADNATRYSLTVTTAREAGSDAVVVVDRVPADFQVTDCDLGDARFSCTSEIVTVDGEVFTQLTWNLGDVPAGSEITLTYQAFVGLQQITAPDGAANGAATRPGANGRGVENTATATGVYTGSVAENTTTSVTVTAKAAVTVLDLGVVKSASRPDFFAGENVDFTLGIRTSQFVTSAGIVLTDTLPDGLCPIVPAGVPTIGSWPADCPAPGSGTVTGGTMTSAVAHADGTFTLTFTVDDAALAADEDAAITYTAYMRGEYRDGSRTSSGDTVVNAVEIEGDVTPTPENTVDSGTTASSNGSSASLQTGTLTMTKTVWSNPDRQVIAGAAAGTDTTCASAPADEFVGSGGPLLQLGDVVCFRITVDFTDGSSTRDAIVSDFLPPGTELVEWSEGPRNDVTVAQAGSGTQWRLGDLNANGSRYVAPAATLELDLLVRVITVPAADATADLTGNLAKLRYTSGDGRVMAARDEVDLTLAPVAPLTLAKSVNGVGSAAVREGEEVTYTVAVTHGGDAASGNDYPLDSVNVVDVLPAGFVCADVSSGISAPTTCTDDGPLDERSQLSWALTGAALGDDRVLSPGETITLTCTVVIPGPLSISSRHENVAAVTRYTAATTDGTSGSAGAVTFYPADRLGAFPDAEANAPTASDTATVTLGDAVVAKNVSRTGITAPGNSALTQAAIGEEVDYVYSVTIPAKTSVFSGFLDDGLPTGGRLLTISGAAGAPTVTGIPTSDVGVGCSADADQFRLCGDGTLRFPAVWTNDEDTPVTIAVTLPTRVANVAANTHAVTIPNTATFQSAEASGGALVARGTASAGIEVVEPQITLAKSSSSSTISGTQVITYTLTATNAAGRAPLYEPVIVDCLPAPLTATTVPAGAAGPVAGNGANGCPTGYSVITFPLDGPMLGGTTQTRTYRVTVPSSVPAGQTYTNTAALQGSSLPGTQVVEREYSASANRTVTVNRPTITKSASQTVTVAGQNVTWTVTAALPANTEFFDAAITDALPALLGPAANSGWSVTCGGGDEAWRTGCVPATFLPAASGTPNTFGVLLGTIAPSTQARTVTLTLTTRLPANTTAADAAVLNNTAQIRWNRTDKTDPSTTAPANWDDSVNAAASTTVRHPLVSVAKTVSDQTPAQGEIFTYTVTATASAARGVAAHNVSIVDTVPSGVVVLDAQNRPLANGESTASGGVWNLAARTLTWTITTLDAGATSTFRYPALLAESSSLTGAGLTNTVRPAAWDSLSSGGRTFGPGTAATATVTPQFPKIDATKAQVSPDNPVYIGQDVTFRVTLTNSGGAPARTVDALDTLPSGWTYVPASATVSVRGAAATAVEPTITGRDLRWSDVGGDPVSLQPGERIIVTYRAVAGADVRVGLDVAHVNTVTAANVEDATGGTTNATGPNAYIGTTGTADARIAAADVSITKVANDDFVAGQTGTYTLTVRNDGPDPAVGVRVTDAADLPDGVTLLGATGAGWACTAPVDGELSCVRSVADQPLAAGASWTLTVRAAVAADVADATEIPNTASVTSRTEDRTQDNNVDDDTAVVRAVADLSIVKRGTTEAVAGDGIDWSLTVSNAGPSVSRGSASAPIVLTDDLPDTVAEVSVVTASDGVICEIEDGQLRCEIPFDLAVGQSVVVNLAGTVDSDVAPGAEVSNTAVVTPVTTDPLTTNNTSTSITRIAVQEALTIDKTIVAPEGAGKAVPGETITYRMVVANGGPSDARGVTVLDVLPEGVSFDSVSAGGDRWTATAEGANVRFSLDGTLPAGTTTQFDIIVTVDSAVEGDLTNTATVSSTWRADQDTSAVTVGSDARADLAITKAIDVERIIAGASDVATYTLTVDNLGPSDAAGPIVVTDLLPAGMSVAGDLADVCEVTAADGRERIRCEKLDGHDVDEQNWVIEIPVLVAADVTASTLSNTATVAGPTADTDPVNNTATTPVAILQRASLEVTKDAQESVIAGEDVTWTLTVTNNGPSDAQAVSLTDPLDPRLEFVSASSDTDGVTCSETQSVLCTLGVVAAGQTVTITLVTTVSPTVVDGAEIANTATATSTTIDPATDLPATAEGGDTIVISAQSALTIVKEAAATTVNAGDVATYSISVGNDGPSDAAAPVTIVDELPAGQTFLAATTAAGPATWTCEIDGQTLTCVLESAGAPVSLAAGATAPTLQVTATVSASLAPGSLTNIATASSPTSAESPSDDAEITVVTRADLELRKSHLPGAEAVAGLGFTWFLEIENHGPSDSVATPENPIVVRDTLPDGVTLTDAPASGGTDTVCTVVGEDDGRQIVECLRTSTLPAGATLSLSVHVDIDQAVSGDLTNTATVAPGETLQPDDAIFPDTDTDTVPVVELADLALVKQLATETVVAGESISWTLAVSNLGPSDSNASADGPITVVDTLPAGVTGVTATGDGWVCESTAAADGRDRIECVRSETLPIGEAPLITVTGTVGSEVQGELTNEAIVAPGLTAQPDDGIGPDEDAVTAPVIESADVAITKAVLDEVVSGATGAYRFQIVNLGPSDARDIVVRDDLPEGLSFAEIAATTDLDGWVCAPDESGERAVVCTLDTPLPAGATTVLDIVVNADQRLQGDLMNVVSVASSTPDPDLENNESRVVGLLSLRTDLAIVKEAVGDPVVGGQFDYTLTVSNKGPSTARGVVITDEVPAQLRVDSVTVDGAECVVVPAEGEPTVVTCLVDELGAGETAPTVTITVTVLPDAYPSISNTATVSSATPEDDAALGDNTSTVTSTVPALSDLVITKELTRALVAGFTGEYTLTVTNQGPTADPGPITVTDRLPAGLTFASATLNGDAVECTVGGSAVRCDVGPLGVGETATLVMQVNVADSATGTLVNTAVVSSDADPESPAAEASGEVDRTKLALTGAAPWGILAVGLLILLAGGLLTLRRRREVA